MKNTCSDSKTVNITGSWSEELFSPRDLQLWVQECQGQGPRAERRLLPVIACDGPGQTRGLGSYSRLLSLTISTQYFSTESPGDGKLPLWPQIQTRHQRQAFLIEKEGWKLFRALNTFFSISYSTKNKRKLMFPQQWALLTGKNINSQKFWLDVALYIFYSRGFQI